MNETIKTILYNWIEKKLPEIIPRDISLEPYTTTTPRKIIVITGFRRVGKTYLLFNLIEKLLKSKTKGELVYINFDDERIPEQTSFLTDLLPTIKQTLKEKTSYLFLDEIQDMPQWNKWLRRIYDSEEINIFITGSSSKVSSHEIPTELRGRCLEILVFPLSFNEFLRFKNIHIKTKQLPYEENQKATILKSLDEYIYYGGMPEVVLAPESLKFDILQQYYGTVVRKDIIERFNIKNEEGLKAIIRLLLNSKQYSISKLYDTMKSLQYQIGKTTILNYINYAETSYFLYSIPIFSYKIKDQMQYPRKHYFIDTGFINCLSTRHAKDIGRLYENIVAINLLRTQIQKGNNIFYWKDQRGKEVDFVIKDEIQVKQLIQVCSDIENYDTRKRETDALIKASDHLKCKDLLIITNDFYDIQKVKGKTIVFKPLYLWLLEK